MSVRTLGLLIFVGCMSSLSACDVYDAGLIDDGKSSKDGGTDGGKKPDTDANECVPTGPEICNGIDDDCDGEIDEQPDANAYCDAQLLNAVGFCTSGGCFKDRCISEEFYDCDGEPSNGCEPYCDCHVCDDAGTDDGGADGG